MNEIWKIWKTAQFIGTSYLKTIPTEPTFKDQNRQSFHNHLMQIEGEDAQSKSWLTHLRRINYYCDQNDVALLDKEKAELENLYNRHTATSVHVATDKEKDIFQDEAGQFPKDSLNYDLRMFRPGSCFLPDGAIRFTGEN